MTGWFGKQSHKTGLAPGTIVPAQGDQSTPTIITITEYASENLEYSDGVDLEQSLNCRDTPEVSWISVHGLEPEVIKKLGNHYGLHKLTLEDIYNTDHRPKFEEFDNYIFITLKILRLNPDGGSLISEQISLVVGRGFVISFQESNTGLFEPIRTRLEKASGRIRQRGSDYLAYALLDTVIDNYYLILEDNDRIIDELEEELTGHPGDDFLERIYTQRRETVLLRRSVWPLKDVVQSFESCNSELIDGATGTFLRDLRDHVLGIIDTVDIFREMLISIHDNYRMLVGERLNQIMKVLTIIATIFIPLTFVAGIYGMNFEAMPELKMKWAYPATLGLMAGVAGVMAYLFKKNKWF